MSNTNNNYYNKDLTHFKEAFEKYLKNRSKRELDAEEKLEAVERELCYAMADMCGVEEIVTIFDRYIVERIRFDIICEEEAEKAKAERQESNNSDGYDYTDLPF